MIECIERKSSWDKINNWSMEYVSVRFRRCLRRLLVVKDEMIDVNTLRKSMVFDRSKYILEI